MLMERAADGAGVGVECAIGEHRVDRYSPEIRIADEAVPVDERALHRFHQQVVIVGTAFVD
jgi:hypothetical protein